MNKSKFTEKETAFALKQAETATRLEEVCRRLGMLLFLPLEVVQPE